jgi:hypothetical protein
MIPRANITRLIPVTASANCWGVSGFLFSISKVFPGRKAKQKKFAAASLRSPEPDLSKWALLPVAWLRIEPNAEECKMKLYNLSSYI